MTPTRGEELRHLRRMLELEWPGYAQSVQRVELADAPPAIAEVLSAIGWSPLMAWAWPDPRAVAHEEIVGEWLREGRLEYAIFEDEVEEPADLDIVESSFVVVRDDLPRRLRVLRQETRGGDFALLVADESGDDADPAALELDLRPTWAGQGVAQFVRAAPHPASECITRAIVRDLSEQRTHAAVIGLRTPRRYGQACLPTLAPDMLEVAPDVYLELDIAPGVRPHRLSSHDRSAMADWLATLPAAELNPPVTIFTVEPAR